MLGMAAVALAELKVAVTPAGTPETARLTVPLLVPAGLTTPIVLVALAPPAVIESALAEEDSVKFGVGMVSVMPVDAVNVPDVPVTTTL